MKLLFLKNCINYSETEKLFNPLEEEKIIILEHKNVYTAGKSVKEIPDRIFNTETFKTNRGGLWTWHGKGQVIVYFCYNIRKRKLTLTDFLNLIEKTITSLVINEMKNYVNEYFLLLINNIKSYFFSKQRNKNLQFSIEDIKETANKIENILKNKDDFLKSFIFYNDDKKRGFWCKNCVRNEISKFGFIGLNVSKGWVTHGISINYNNDLKMFDYINPCGLGDVKISSLSSIFDEIILYVLIKYNIKKEIIDYTMTKNIKCYNILDINNFKQTIGNRLLLTLDEKKR